MSVISTSFGFDLETVGPQAVPADLLERIRALFAPLCAQRIADAGWRPEVFACAQEFLAHPRSPSPSCLVLDVSLPDLNGLELQKRIARDRTDMPIIFITGHGDIPMTVQAMKAGAVEFLTKPFTPDVLLSAIQCALEHSHASLDEEANLQALRDRHQSLSRREREVMARWFRAG